ncbi:hypothetical protein CC030809_00055 [Synechococcus phage S-CAM7]|uniref:Type II methyltransferase M.TaqI-like domain-containing protein n=1 Tax=Synechococcus phage S-CAM7 TaxID=1883368 RepID=A0A7D5KUH3_9CAUD|nr:hypothetical protein CC030809_00055 [Synechococcus phage S-CAM7]
MKNNLLFRLKGQQAAAQELVSEIPERLFTDDSIVFYDPAMGGGQYLQEILNRAKVDYDRDISARVFGSEESVVHLNWVKRNTSVPKENITKGPADMNFSACIGNPPYSDRTSDSPNSKNLDSVFFENAISRCGYVSMIIRAKHFVDARSNFRRKLFTSGHLVSIKRLDDSVFPTIQNTETCVVTWDNNHSGPCKIEYKDGTVHQINLTRDTVIKLDNPEFGKVIENNLADRWIRGHLSRGQIVEGDAPMIEIMGSGKSPVIANVSVGQEDTARNRYGVIMNVNGSHGSFGVVHIKPFSASISNSVIALLTNTEEEAIILYNYLKSEEVSGIVASNKQKQCNTRTLFSNIPSPL